MGRILPLLLLCVVAGCFINEASASDPTPYKRVCYYTNWSQYRPGNGRFTVGHIDPFLCTHLLFAFATFDNSFQVTFTEHNDAQTIAAMNGLKSRNPELKILLAIGGWNFGVDRFSCMAATSATRQSFLTSLVPFLRRHGLDGVDYDWEYPAARGSPPGDQQKFTILLEDTMRFFKLEAQKTRQPRLLISAAVAAGRDTVSKAYEIKKIHLSLDFINLMAYDMQNFDGKTSHHSPLFASRSIRQANNVDAAVKLWLEGGTPARKLVVGLPTYGRSFSLSGHNTGVGAPVRGVGTPGTFTREAGILAYYEVCPLLQAGSTRKWLDDQKVPYTYKGDQWVGYDDAESFKHKLCFIKEGSLGGSMIWAMDMDDFTGSQCHQGGYPLLKTIKKILTSNTGSLSQCLRQPQPHGDSIPPTPWAPSLVESSCEGRPDGLYAEPSDPAVFLNCHSGIADTIACPAGLLFNPTVIVCDAPRNVVTTEEPPPPPLAAASHSLTQAATTPRRHKPKQDDTFCEDKENGLYPYPNDNHYFYQCSNSITYVIECPSDLVFDPVLLVCTWP